MRLLSLGRREESNNETDMMGAGVRDKNSMTFFNVALFTKVKPAHSH